MTDARFQDGGDKPVNLVARDADDLAVISALLQDAVVPATEMAFDARRRRFAVLANRFRWEDQAAAEKTGRAYERVRAVLTVADVRAVLFTGFDRADKTATLQLLSLRFTPAADGTGRLTLVFAGTAELALEVEALEVGLKDVSRPYAAPSGKAPGHDAAG